MAKLKNIPSDKLTASTLLEVIVSMIIILVVFGIAMMIYTNISGSSLSAQKLQAQSVLNKEMQDVHTTFLDSVTYTTNGLTIEKSIRPYTKAENVYLVHLKAFGSGGVKMAELNKIVLKDE